MKFLKCDIDSPAVTDIAQYESTGGYGALKKALLSDPKELYGQIKGSILKGRGGAAFPTHIKWSFTVESKVKPKYLLVNADEGEPGTFKDRAIMEKNPHLLVEGCIIAAFVGGIEKGVIYLRAEYPLSRDRLNSAIEQARAKGYIGRNILGSGFDFELMVHSGAGAYICGEASSMLDSLEGKRGFPRVKPPFTALSGYMSQPSMINNVETYALVPVILNMGPDAFLELGTKDSPGTKLFSVSGHVVRPGVYELPLGITLREIIYDHCQGVPGKRAIKGVIPGGVSTPVMTPDALDCPMDFVSPQKYGSMLGSGGIIVLDETVCMVKVALRIAKFFEHESCGKCTPCREGTGWLRAVLERIEHGTGRPRDLEVLMEVGHNMELTSFCPLGESAGFTAMAFVERFRKEFEDHISQGKCTVQGAAA